MSIASDRKMLEIVLLVFLIIVALSLLFLIFSPKAPPCQDTEPRVLIERLHRALGPDAYLVEHSKKQLDKVAKALIIAGEDNSQDTVIMSKALLDVLHTLENVRPIVKKYVEKEGADE